MIRLFDFGGGQSKEPRPTEVGPERLGDLVLACGVDPILALDESDKIAQATRAAAALFGQAEERLVGSMFVGLFARSDRERLKAMVRSAREGLPQRMEALLQLKGGDERLVDLSAASVRSGSTSYGTVVTLRDVTEQRPPHHEIQRSEARHRQLFDDA